MSKRSPVISKIVLDVLKPHKPTIIELSKAIGNLEGVNRVNIVLREVDVTTETVKITVEGNNLNYDEIAKVIMHFGAAIHSVDEVIVNSPVG